MSKKWQVLAERMRGTGKFMESRITPTSLMQAYQQNKSVLIEDQYEIVAYAGVWSTPDPRWLEFGAIWVSDERRGNRISSQMYVERMKLVPSGYSVCSITSSDQAAHLALKHGFVEVGRDEWFRAVPSVVSCGPCDRDIPGGYNYKLHCPYRAERRPDIGICRMFIKTF